VKIGNGPKAVEAKRVAAGKKLGVKKDVAVINLVVKAIEAEASVVLVKANAVADRADHPRDDPARAAPDSEVDVAPEIWDPAGLDPVPSCESCLCSLPWTPTPTENCPLPKLKMLPKH
jgi:hypothetical protein